MTARKIILCFSTSLPRFSGDYSGSFLASFYHPLFENHLPSEYRLIYIGLCDRQTVAGFSAKKIWLANFIGLGNYFGHGQSKAMLGRLSNPLTLVQLPFKLMALVWMLLATSRQLWRIVRRFQSNYPSSEIILWTHFAFPGAFLGAIVSKYSGVLHFCSCHSSGVHLLRKMNFVGRLIIRFCQKYTQFHAISKFLADILKRNWGVSSIIMHLPVVSLAPSVFAPSRKKYSSRRILLGYVGSFHEVKGIRALLQDILAYIQLEVNNPTKKLPIMGATTLWVIGQGPQEAEIRQLVFQLELLNQKYDTGLHIHLRIGRIEKTHMTRMLANFDFTLFPSVVWKGYAEGIPVTAIESLQAGVPILIHRTGGLAELFSNAQPGLEFSCLRDLTSQIGSLTKNGPAYSGFRREAIQLGNTFSHAAGAQAVLEIYNSRAQPSAEPRQLL